MTRQKQFEQAYDAGRRARQAGRGRYDGPRYGITPEDQALRDEWARGWEDEEALRAAARKAA